MSFHIIGEFGECTKNKTVVFDNDAKVYIFECPHCDFYIEVPYDQVNCHIFRHAFFFEKFGNSTNLTSQLNPHAPKSECDRLASLGTIYGCGKPFRLVRKGSEYVAEICGYI